MLFFILSTVTLQDGKVRFILKTEGENVILTGDFLNWSQSGIKMEKKEFFECLVDLKPGIYKYKFIVDGKWIYDPDNPLKVDDGYGGYNSVFILLEKDIITKPMISYKDGLVNFMFYSKDAKSVYLAGDFNNWDKTSCEMKKNGDFFFASLIINPGTHYYKFIVDGKWIEDPLNPSKVDDGYGGYNSVFTLLDDGKIVFTKEEIFDKDKPVIDKLKKVREPVYFTIIWHQHQPFYSKKDGLYTLPWVRLHGIKDYYDMAYYAFKYNVKFVVNLSTSLLLQIEDISKMMNEGKNPDTYLEITMKNAGKLTQKDKEFLILNFFSANWDNMIKIHRRYKELLEKRVYNSDGSVNIEKSIKNFSNQDFLDLQVWFNLAWFDPDFRKEYKLITGDVVNLEKLFNKERNFSEEDKKIIFDAQRKIINAIIPLHRKLMEEGRIEVSTTPYSHPILPLIYDSDVAKICMKGAKLPSRFSFPDDAENHIKLAIENYERIFGRKPSGFWPGEGSVSMDVVKILKGKIKWIATDEGILQNSLNLQRLKKEDIFSMYDINGLKIVFRLRELSDAIGFKYQKMEGLEGANHLIYSLYNYYKNLQDGTYLIVLILDGENAWEWFKNDGKEFFDAFYSQLENAEWIKTITISEYIDKGIYRNLDYLWPGSWINADFNIWIGESQENTAWEYLKRVRMDFEKMKEGKDNKKVENAYENLLKAEGSDWFWWYGDDQNSMMDEMFDRTFRDYLKNVYIEIGEKIPEFLNYEIK